jgi:phosphotransferase system enzyme I (PtsP)
MAQAAGHASSRLLLKRLRDVMAAEATARERLDRIVRLIAADMVAEVCSAYAMRPGEILELIATQGLKPEAVGHTRLRVGEGIVGDIALRARPQALADAQSHPNFAYRPETGEEIFQSLMGVPMLRGGRVQGVLVVQNRAARQYAEEEIEALETIAMVVAELLTGDELARTEDAGTTLAGTAQPDRLEGLRINGGLAIGHAVLHRPGWVIRQVVAEDPLVERRRLDGAIEALHLALDTILESLDASAETREVMEAYRMFARDRGWLHRLREAVAGGLTAEAAVQKVLNDTRARMQQVSDAYLRERLLDLEDLNHRLMSHLVGDSPKPGTRELPAATIVIARSMGPAELLDYDRSRLAGLVLEEGSATAHVAIVARGLDIPVLGRVRGALERIEAGDRLVLAADVGQIILRPGEDVLALFESHAAAREARRRDYAQQARIPAITRDGVQISVKVNAGLLIDAAALEETGADGIGLYRTEIPFMVRQTYPTVEQQTELYGRVLDHAAGKPVTFRTLDIGGDKKLSYFKFDEEENPAMGWRALRIGLDRPSILRQQLRALLTAGAGRQINIMFPMVADVTELDRARALLAREQG